MKNKTKTKNILILILFLLIFIKFVSAGATYPVPSEIQLKPGEEGRFSFIVTSSGTYAQDCIVNPDLKVPFKVEFDETSFTIPLDITAKQVIGTVYASKETPTGKYTETFSVSCLPTSPEGEGSSISTTIRNIPINVDIVNERTYDNLNIPKPEKPIQVPTYFYIILIAVIIAIVIYIIYSKKKK